MRLPILIKHRVKAVKWKDTDDDGSSKRSRSWKRKAVNEVVKWDADPETAATSNDAPQFPHAGSPDSKPSSTHRRSRDEPFMAYEEDCEEDVEADVAASRRQDRQRNRQSRHEQDLEHFDLDSDHEEGRSVSLRPRLAKILAGVANITTAPFRVLKKLRLPFRRLNREIDSQAEFDEHQMYDVDPDDLAGMYSFQDEPKEPKEKRDRLRLLKVFFKAVRRSLSRVWPILLVCAAFGAILLDPVIAAEFAAWTGFYGPLIAALALAILYMGRKEFAEETIEQQKQWNHSCSQIDKWRNIWLNLPGGKMGTTPVYIDESDFPPPPAKPKCRQIIFTMRGKNYLDYVKLAPKIAPALDKTIVSVEPVQTKKAAGEVHLSFLSVWHDLEPLGALPHLNPKFDDYVLNFAARAAVTRAFLDLKLGVPLFIKLAKLTVSDGPRRNMIVESWWALGGDTSFEQCMSKTSLLKEKLECDWLRVYMRPGNRYMSLFFGNHPHTVEFINDDYRKAAHEADWSYSMLTAGITGSNGLPPTLVKDETNEQGLQELTFQLQPGIDPNDIHKTIPKLQNISGWQYISMKRMTEPSRVTLVCGEKDPLSDTYLFPDFETYTLRKPERGEPDLDWQVGVGSDGRPITFSFDHEDPHLLVAGTTGSGKSGIVNAMLVQLLHNNHPDDLHVWLAEPKVELQAYQHLAHVRRFLAPGVIDDSEHAGCRWMLQEAYNEMRRRNMLMADHPSRPQKISEARGYAKAEPDKYGHLLFPYLVMVIEECSTYFSKPTVKEDKVHYDEILRLISELARKARSAGIYIIYATQYPTTQNIPQILKMNSRRIGLKCAGQVGSLVIIDMAGLETIREPGRGKVSTSRGYSDFRGFLFERSVGSDEIGEVDIRGDYLREMPSDVVWPKLSEGMVPNPQHIGRQVIWPDGTRHDPETPPLVLEALARSKEEQEVSDHE